METQQLHLKRMSRQLWTTIARARAEAPRYLWTAPDAAGFRSVLTPSGATYRVRRCVPGAHPGSCSCPAFASNARDRDLNAPGRQVNPCKHLAALTYIQSPGAFQSIELPALPAAPKPAPAPDCWELQEAREQRLILRAGSVSAALALGILG